MASQLPGNGRCLIKFQFSCRRRSFSTSTSTTGGGGVVVRSTSQRKLPVIGGAASFVAVRVRLNLRRVLLEVLEEQFQSAHIVLKPLLRVGKQRGLGTDGSHLAAHGVHIHEVMVVQRIAVQPLEGEAGGRRSATTRTRVKLRIGRQGQRRRRGEGSVAVWAHVAPEVQ